MRIMMITKTRTMMTAPHRGRMIQSGTMSSSTSVGLDAKPAGSASDWDVSGTWAVLIDCEYADDTDD